MLVYREGGRRVNCRAELARLRRSADDAAGSAEGALNLLIQLGEFEAGLADALAPDRDAVHQTASAIRAITEDAASAWLHGDGASLARPLTRFEAARLPISIELRVSEGYA